MINSFFIYIIEFIFEIALIINALAFIPQAISIYKAKSSKSVSLTTFSIFIFIQAMSVIYGIIKSDWILIMGYILAMIACSSVLVLAFKYKKQ
ncbi:hypothetical protein IBE11_08990 [Francisella tularensis subsp. novicida]|uniref:SemiSWEET family sugar transporter n=1 Tax=Francisella tularensis TaxID=263 RepID=UPI0005053CA0|nr:PQ-loop domain-containing transporter [Francisella tularensis]AJJ48317.1 PQ loop repeat family protein [Francisella tularensis subsp. novicida]KFJ70501.1 PQ loop repeat family protein [Francisella tularensis subsp. novicida]MBK2345242.1 hypothetical protein [Francisella tularensis subsp. novicida]MBK2350585.1 hypothetical protein [Francisella tularensis subsp. novicida]MBK2354145.1 hypothetical protein [Francisella tularensis subsp. novicida]